ncbi:FadR/GntR family transcriptional regulator [Spinactinospora alkalitolerans]
MAERFGVSRATLRQALSALNSAGLIESRVGDGTFVRRDAVGTGVTALVEAFRMVPGTLGDQLGLRRLIEPQVAREAAEHAHGMDFDYLRQSIARQESKVSTGESFVDEDSTFHLAIAQATQNPLIVKMVEGIHELLRESRERSLRAPNGPRRSFEGHRRILTAIERGDGRAAYEAMVSHIADVERLSLHQITEEPSLAILDEAPTPPGPPTPAPGGPPGTASDTPPDSGH